MLKLDFQAIVKSQFEGALSMLVQCVRRCPDALWDEPVGTREFWRVVYHVMCFTDLYFARSLAEWEPDTTGTPGARSRSGAAPLHPRGLKGLWDDRPGRSFEREELVRYSALLRSKLARALRSEDEGTLAGASGFRWIKGSRGETYIYNLRHLQHHVGQLTAFLHRHGVRTSWTKGGRG